MFLTKKIFVCSGQPTWDLVEKIGPLDPAISYGASLSSVSLNHDGNLIAIGDKTFDSNSGAVKIFRYVDSWVDDLTSTSGAKLSSVVGSSGRFGHQVRLSRGYGEFTGGSKGTEIVIGEPGNNTASVYFRAKSGGIDWGWGFAVSDPQVGGFGGSVAINRFGNYIAVGCGGDPLGPQTSGLVRLFHNPFLQWNQVGSDIVGSANSRLGNNISIKSEGSLDNGLSNPGTLLLGTDSLEPSVQGFARVVSCSGSECSSWTQSGSDFIESGNRFFGYFVSMNYEATRIAVGGAGVVKTFDLAGGVWSQFGQNLQGNNVKMCYLGNRVAVRSSDGVRIYQRDSGSWGLISFVSSGGESFGDIDLSGNGTVLATASKSGVSVFKQKGYSMINFF